MRPPIGVDFEKILRVPKPIQRKWQGGAQMHYKPCIEIIGGARALLPMEVYAYELRHVKSFKSIFIGISARFSGYCQRKKRIIRIESILSRHFYNVRL